MKSKTRERVPCSLLTLLLNCENHSYEKVTNGALCVPFITDINFSAPIKRLSGSNILSLQNILFDFLFRDLHNSEYPELYLEHPQSLSKA